MRLQTISFFRTTSIFALAIGSVFGGGQANQALAQGPDGVKVAVIDMQEVLNDYYKTKIEIEKLNALIERRQKQIEGVTATQKEPIEKLGELKKKLGDSAIAETVKKKVLKEFQVLAQIVGERQKEIVYRQQKASVEIATARAEMEKILLTEIKTEMKAVIAANGVDLVFDKSFLPKSSKAIMFTSSNVNDLSQKIVASLNAMAPVSVPAQ